jgi:hypothetical protein
VSTPQHSTGIPNRKESIHPLRRPWPVLSLALKATLAGLLLFALAHPQWGRFADKAMGVRALTYPIPAVLVPIVWVLWNRLRPIRYPWDVDALLVAPFAIDLAGNAGNLFDTIPAFDDACHFASWALIGAAFGALLRRGAPLPRWILALACAGVGAIAAILWELAEYATFVLNTESVGIYRDTLGDESLGLAGATLAGILIALRRLPTASQPDRS